MKYRWEGRVIRLTEEDYARWRARYSGIPDFDAELQAADDYYAETPPRGGKWFFAVSNWLKRTHTNPHGPRGPGPNGSGQSDYGREQQRIREEMQAELRRGYQHEDDSHVPELPGSNGLDCEALDRPALKLVGRAG